MGRGAWRAIVVQLQRVGHDGATERMQHMFIYFLPETKSVIYMYYSHLVKSQGNVLWTMSNHCKVFKAHFWKRGLKAVWKRG